MAPTIETAVKTILSHAGLETRCETPPLLATLRPFTGLHEDSFLEIMASIIVARARLDSEPVDRRLVLALWQLCSLATAWGVAEDGMLRRNGLIKDSDWRLLQRWIRIIEITVERLLAGERERGDAFNHVAEYIAQRGVRNYREIFLPLFTDGLSAANPDVRRAMAAAIGVYGAEAAGAADALRAAMYQPVRETDGSALASVQEQIRKTLTKIGVAGGD